MPSPKQGMRPELLQDSKAQGHPHCCLLPQGLRGDSCSSASLSALDYVGYTDTANRALRFDLTCRGSRL